MYEDNEMGRTNAGSVLNSATISVRVDELANLVADLSRRAAQHILMGSITPAEHRSPTQAEVNQGVLSAQCDLIEKNFDRLSKEVAGALLRLESRLTQVEETVGNQITSQINEVKVDDSAGEEPKPEHEFQEGETYIQAIHRLRKQGLSNGAVADLLGISKSQLDWWLYADKSEDYTLPAQANLQVGTPTRVRAKSPMPNGHESRKPGPRPGTHVSPGSENKSYALAVLMLAAGDSIEDICIANDLDPRTVGTIKRWYGNHIEALQTTKPGPPRWEYVQKHFGLAVSDRKMMEEKLTSLGYALRNAGFTSNGD